MATARLGGFSPEIGFFAFLGGSLAFAFFGNNRFLSCGADSTITPIFGHAGPHEPQGPCGVVGPRSRRVKVKQCVWSSTIFAKYGGEGHRSIYDSDRKLVPPEGEEIGQLLVRSVQDGVVGQQPWYEPMDRLPAQPIISPALKDEFDSLVVESPVSRPISTPYAAQAAE